MPLYDVTLLVELSMQVKATSAREATDIVIAQCYAPADGRIQERMVDIRDERAMPLGGEYDQ